MPKLSEFLILASLVFTGIMFCGFCLDRGLAKQDLILQEVQH